jgi:holo-[acyl-carrier protein] synthase
MILGLGIDLVETSRIEDSLNRFGDRFLNRVFRPSEVEYCMKMKFPARHLAARFAAKEAVSKAFGTGIGSALGWKDMEILRKESGEPFLVLHGSGAELAKNRNISGSMISLTHHETSAAAVAVLYKDDSNHGENEK